MDVAPGNTQYFNQLHTQIAQYFDANEVRTLCFDLGIDLEKIPDETKSALILHLIVSLAQQYRLQELIDQVRRQRPNVAWQDVPADFELPSSLSRENSQQKADYQARDDSVQGGRIGGYKAFGDTISVGSIDNTEGIAIGEGSSASVQQTTPANLPTEEPQAAANPFQTIEPHNGTLLATRHGVQIYGITTQTPWNLPVDAFVLPSGYGSVFAQGQMARALEQALGNTNAIQLAVAYQKTLQNDLTSDTPFFLRGGSPSDFWTLPATSRRIIVATASDADGFSLDNAAVATKAIIQLAMDNDCRKITMPALGAGSGGLPEKAVILRMLDSILEAIPPATDSKPALAEIFLTTINPETLTALQQRFLKRPQAARNDQPIGPDLLQVETAVYALAEMCMLKDLEPPLAVGVLGGWGSGKSFVMHLMQERVAQLRGRKVSPTSPYIGHVYQIKFDAWTYAKSNLWASLMQTIFYELNAQLTRERELVVALGATEEELRRQKLAAGGPLWQVLANPNLKSQQARDIINFATELEEHFRKDPPKEVVQSTLDFLRNRQSDPDGKPETEDLLWTELRKLKEMELQELRKTEEALAQKQADLEEARISLRKEVDNEIATEAKMAAWQPLQNAFKQLFGAATDTVKKMFTEADAEDATSLSVTVKNMAILGQMIRNNPTEFVAFLLLSVFLLTVRLEAESSTVQLPAVVLSVGSALMAFIRIYDKWISLIRQSFAAYQLQVEAERSRLEDGREERFQHKLAQQSQEYKEAKQTDNEAILPVANIPGLEEEIIALQATAKRQRQRVGITASYVSLLDFVSSRLDNAIYEKELGLMHQVQRDLQELSDSLTTEGHDLFPRQGARVILYIDDLDRCPPLRVVEVLEAVQLLLKTNLFIVVLAIDVRFITRALERVYKGILTRRGNPSGLDYIEKIIQIPYRIQPIEDGAVGHYLAQQMIIAPEELADGSEDTGANVTETAPDGALATTSHREVNGGDPADHQDVKPEPEETGHEQAEDLSLEVIEISHSEYESMEKCCRQVSMTPRAIKRLANVYKLLKIIWHYENNPSPTPEMVTVIMTLLALSERYPNQMRDIFENIQFEIRNNATANLADFIDAQVPEPHQKTYAIQEWQQLRQNARILIADVSLNQIDLKILNQVRSFCFVGDIGYDPNEIANELNNSPT